MTENHGAVTFKGNPMTLVGEMPKAGDTAPDCTCTGLDMSDVKLSDLKGKKVLLVSVPSLDTPVCDIEAKRFNEEAGKLGSDVAVVTVSRDLPFAQKRWCGANDADNLVVVSDYKYRSFGEAFGLEVKELAILARAVFAIDADGRIVYEELVKEIADQPDYDAALAAVKTA